MSPIRRAHDAVSRALSRLGSLIVQPDPHPEPSRLDLMDGRGTVPLSDEHDLMAMVDATHEDPQTVAAAAKGDGPPTPLPKIRPDQLWITAALSRLGQQSQGHQIHRDADRPCDCCKALDYELAGVIEDMEGRP